MMILFHGSTVVVNNPTFGLGSDFNDYGKGFYLTQYEELGKEWASSEGVDGYLNKYSLGLDNLNVLNLMDEKFNILNWLTLVLYNRKPVLSSPIQEAGFKYLIDNFFINQDKYDLIIGYRCDDSYFTFARRFLRNEISVNALDKMFRLGDVKEQYVLKSEKAFSLIKFLSYDSVDSSLYFLKRNERDLKARRDFDEILRVDDDSLFLRDIIKRGINNDNFTL